MDVDENEAAEIDALRATHGALTYQFVRAAPPFVIGSDRSGSEAPRGIGRSQARKPGDSP